MRRLIEGHYEEGYLEHAFAFDAHDGQTRKGKPGKPKEPYIRHPESVAKLVDSYGGDDDQVRAAFLHDTKEDCGVDYETIETLTNSRVADIVTELTNDNDEVERLGKEKYMSRHLLELSDDALLVKLCDVLHNLSDNCPQSQRDRIEINVNVLRKNRRVRGPAKEVLEAIRSLLKHS